LSDAELTDDYRRQDNFRAAFAAAPAPVVTYALIVVNVLIFVAMLVASSSLIQPSNQQMIRWGADFGPLTLNGQWWRMITSCFLHFGFIHIGMNMFILFQVGVLTEKLFGSVRFLVLYILAGIGGSLLSLYSHPSSVSAGASGAVFGVYGGLLAFLLVQRGFVPTKLALGIAKSAGIFIAYNIVYGLSSPGTDIQAHLGGLVSGFLLGCVLARPLSPSGQRIYPVRTVLVILCVTAVGYAAFMHLPRPDEGNSQWLRHMLGDERISLGNNNYVIYTAGTKKSDAQNLADALVKDGFFSKPNEVVLLSKGADGVVISIPTGFSDGGAQASAGLPPWDDPRFLAWAQVTGVLVAPSVGGPPVKIAILSRQGAIKKVVAIDTRQLVVGTADSIWYSGSATPEDAEALGKALQKMKVFGNSGMRVFLSKGSDGTRLSFTVKDGAWDNPKLTTTFITIGAGVANSIGGLPLTVSLMNRDMERKKDMVIVKKLDSTAGYKVLPAGV